ncbi:hypothetical protein AcV5_005797 [Taiwanofungus camphoratus]|nr:hypothetical protein AcW2_004241 [Antrodia cinnamomea]KAI0933725.1 hypothetical protein AcV5_005797 [Antrodia cinnamomea]KAI0948485.1 hypothetical protein AcV7_009216 [Antrodia cinnamomea]
MNVSASDVTSSSSRPSQAPGTNTVFTTSYPPVITTTVFTGAPLPTGPVADAPKQKTPVPVGAIAGGVAGGVFLAIAAVLIWTWWGRCIKRQKANQRKEALANLEVRENTRRNASSGSYTNLPPTFPSSRRHIRKSQVRFAASPPISPQSTLKVLKEDVKPERVEPDLSPTSGAVPPHKPVRPSPLGRNSSRNEAAPLLMARARSERQNRRAAAQSNPPPVQPFLRRPLAKKASAASSASVYSTESGEERQNRVSSSLIMAALGHLDPRRSFLANYLPLTAPKHGNSHDIEQSRLSQVSAASVYSQPDEPSEHVGYAYGGSEEGPTPS